jgi:hypothetical protein
MHIEAEASRKILKQIRYGINDFSDQFLSRHGIDEAQIKELRSEFVAERGSIGVDKLPMSNFVFYRLIQKKYPDFRFEVNDGSVRSNIYMFKNNGRIPSLASMLIFDSHVAHTKIERRFNFLAGKKNLAGALDVLLEKANLVMPNDDTMRLAAQLFERAQQSKKPLRVFTAVCPDYSYQLDAEGKPRYTFEHVGENPGLAGDKLIGCGRVLREVADKAGIAFQHELFGGEFEYSSFSQAKSDNAYRGMFLRRVKNQLHTIARQLYFPTGVRSFFELVGGEANWNILHGNIIDEMTRGNFGTAALSPAEVTDIFESRLPLYEKWFPDCDRTVLWRKFIFQAAEYALIGMVYKKVDDSPLVIAVDHFRMGPFYSYSGPIPVLYVKTDYL